MERLEDDHLESRIVQRIEHRHRYMWAGGYAAGDVCDLACGYGYGSEILSANPKSTSYVGIDASTTAIKVARQRYSGEGRRFLCARATGIPLADKSMDTVVSLETLEHLSEPRDALREFRRVMRRGALLVGSVPSSHFEERCEATYGANPYHVQRFAPQHLIDLLREFFPTVCLGYSALEIVSHIGELVDGIPRSRETVMWVDHSENRFVNGSLHFIATDRQNLDVASNSFNGIHLCQGLTEFEAAQVMPLRRALQEAERLVAAKDEHLTAAAELIRQRDQLIRQKDELLAEANAKLARSISLPWKRKA